MERPIFQTEADLCACFIATLQGIDGWTVYPETAGFDILAVYKTGHQLGVEAKLKLNAKVADQILPDDWLARYDAQGPDFRAVIVPAVTDASGGIAKMLRILGVQVWTPDLVSYSAATSEYKRDWSFTRALGEEQITGRAAYDDEARVRADEWAIKQGWRNDLALITDLRWHDWNPAQRCDLPEIVPHVPAGVPAPVRLTPWKIGALRVMADLEVDGFVTAKSVRAHGVDPRRFCASDGWLEPLGDGKWGRGRIPAFDQQHPDAYAQILAKARNNSMTEAAK